MASGAKAPLASSVFTRPIRLRSGQAAEAPLFDGRAGGWLRDRLVAGGQDSRFLTGFAGSE
jgi:hypothetical protein